MFWNNLKNELNYRGIQIKEFCCNNDLNYNSICNAISKDTVPNIELAYKIASALNVTVEYLLTGNNFSGLNDDEMEIIKLYKILPDDKKAMIKQLLAAISIEK